MIAAGQKIHFGKHTLILMAFRKTLIAFVAFIVSGVIAFIGSSLALGIAGLIALGGTPSKALADHIAGSISYFDMVLFLGSIIFGLIGVIIALLEYRNHTFELGDLSVTISRGIVNEMEASIPYHQISDVTVMRTAVHQLFGTSRLTLVTNHGDTNMKGAGDTVFDPIDADIAEEIRSFLESRVGVQVIQQHA
jgi:membrane protein YdbS with pleckstrin-like domain